MIYLTDTTELRKNTFRFTVFYVLFVDHSDDLRNQKLFRFDLLFKLETAFVGFGFIF